MKTPKAKYTEHDVQRAISDIKSGLSLRVAALRHGIPRSTLSHRVNGMSTRQEAHQYRQTLSAAQESCLQDWVIVQQDLGFPPTHAQVREFASRVAVRNGHTGEIGIHWMEAFLRRNPGIKTVRGQKIDTERFNGATTERIKDFFVHINHPEIKKIKPENRHNMDEFGVMEGLGGNGLFLGSSEKKAVLCKEPGKTPWITILETISATGKALTPLVIFKGKTVQQQWFPESSDFLASWDFTATNKGWTDDETAVKWLEEIFIPQTTPAKAGDKRLLIVDGHGSHTTDNFMFKCYENGIYLLFLPSHSSHVTQPLDVAVYGPLKKVYRREVQKLVNVTDLTPVGKITFLKCYYLARGITITSKNILSGWRATGLWPVNQAKPLLNRMTKQPAKRAITPPREIVNWSQGEAGTLLNTPQSSVGLRDAFSVISSSISYDCAIRLFIAKVGKGLDTQNTIIVGQDRDLSLLKHQIEELRPKKRKKVLYDANTKFAKVPDIWRARGIMYGHLDPPATSELVRKTKFESLCHSWSLTLPNGEEMVHFDKK